MTLTRNSFLGLESSSMHGCSGKESSQALGSVLAHFERHFFDDNDDDDVNLFKSLNLNHFQARINIRQMIREALECHCTGGWLPAP